jgi:hypothetical protein
VTDPITFIHSLSYADKMLYVVANSNAAAFAYQRLHVHHTGARVQMRRLVQALELTQQESLPANSTHEERLAYVATGLSRVTPLLSELHFYFVAWGGCGRMLRILTKQPEFFEARKLFDGYRGDFTAYRKARDSFEHFHDRLPGERDHGRMRETRETPTSPPVTVYWGVEGGRYRHSDLSCDITPASLELLDRIVNGTVDAVHQIIDERLCAKFSRSRVGELP